MGNIESNSSRLIHKRSKYLAYRITEVLDNSPGQRVGLSKNDFILKINGRKLSQLKEDKIINFVKVSIMHLHIVLSNIYIFFLEIYWKKFQTFSFQP